MTMSSAQPLSAPRNVDEAQRAAAHPKRSVWVSASAGSGKTKVLADRVTRLLLAGVAPSRILCLTFTRAAAAEMSIRLTQRLADWATCSEGALETALDKLLGRSIEGDERDRARRLFAQVLACPGGMRIQTIHAFAQDVLRRFPVEAGLPPHFTVMEEADAVALRRDAFTDLLQNAAEGRDPAAQKALQLLAPRMDEGRLDDLLMDIDSHAERLNAAFAKQGSADQLIAAQRTALDFGSKETQEDLLLKACEEGAFDRAGLLHVARLVKERGSKKYVTRVEFILEWLEKKNAPMRAASFDAYLRGFLTKEGETFADFANSELLKECPDIADIFACEAARLQTVMERIETLGFIEEGAAVLALWQRLRTAYAAQKAARAALDYDDLIVRTKQVLSKDGIVPWVLYKLDGGIDHILVDESQDTNPAQWDIVEALTGDFFAGETARSERGARTLFVVGDEKQSIYSFLKADPEAFASKRALFEARIRGAGEPFDEVPLTVSFRSAPAVLRAVDAVFADEVVRQGVSHTPVRHEAFRREGAGRVELWPLIEKPKDDDNKKKAGLKEAVPWDLPLGYESVHDPAAMLAQQLAAQIRLWLKEGQTIYDRDLKAERPLRADDIMILVQRRGAFVDHLVRALKAAAVPVTGVDRMNLTQQLAVMDLLALLQFILLPEDDLTLACVLRGPLFGAREEDLMRLAIDRKGTLWHSLLTHSAKDPAFARWRDALEALTALADKLQPLEMLVHILTQACPADARGGRRAMAARLGPDAEDAIDELLNAAEAYGARHAPSLQGFLHWIVSAEVEVKRELEQAAGRVRITTVHGSKGLEAPVIILPDTVRVPDRTKLSKWVWSEDGVLFYVPCEPLHAKLSRWRNRAYDKQIEEYRRLLYVALTRAADRLYIAGYKGERTTSFDQSWYALVERALKPHHQPEAMPEWVGAATPHVVLADYAVPPVAQKEKKKAVLHDAPLPAWLTMPPAPEPLPPRPLMPSRPSEEETPSVSPNDARFMRGRLLHRLLENLPDVPPEDRAAAAGRFLANPQHQLTPVQQTELAQEVLALLDDPRFAPVFAPGSRAEVPIIGLKDERVISGQVDRLALVGEDVWIVDYKTNRSPLAQEVDVPALYRSQMEAYRAVLQDVYPGRRVRCFLLWTYAARFMEILPRT